MKTITLILIITFLTQQILTQTCFGIAATNSSVCSGFGVCVNTDKCSCYSGYGGSSCAIVAPTTTCVWNTNTQTKTDFYPIIDSASLEYNNDNLNFEIMAPIVTGRLNSTVYIQDMQYTDCVFPGQYTSASLDLNAPCYNRFRYQLPWAKGKNCGWSQQTLSDKIVYSGNIFISQIENIGFIRGVPIQRTILRVIPINVNFQTVVSVSSTVKVFAPVNLIAAVTKQAYIAGPPASGIFEFFTSLQYPFIIDTTKPYSMTQVPTGLTATLSEITAQQCQVNQPCNQDFRINLAIGSACSFTGTYIAKFKLACSSTFTAQCPIDPNNNDATIQIEANSENFCAVASVDIKLSGSLKSYADNSYQTEKSSFLLGAKTFYKATVISQKATLKSSTITRVEWTNGTATNVLYDNQIITAEGTNENFALGPNDATTAAFNFDTNRIDVPLDSNSDFNITAFIQVSYQAIDGVTSNALVARSFNLNSLKQQTKGNSQITKTGNPIKLVGPNYKSSSIIYKFSYLLLSIIAISFIF